MAGWMTDDPVLFDRITEILMLLSEVTAGDYSSRLNFDLPEDDPLSALARGINETVVALEESHKRMASYQRELEEKLRTIDRQQIAIRELSTPIIEVWRGVLCLPVVGVLDSIRSAEITEEILKAVVEQEAECVIIDITGIDVMDTGTADHFLRMAKAVQLLGARCVLTGISPAIAQTIVQMGMDMGQVTVHRTLRHALADFIASKGRESRRHKSARGTRPD